jgi:hypothetical protein
MGVSGLIWTRDNKSYKVKKSSSYLIFTVGHSMRKGYRSQSMFVTRENNPFSVTHNPLVVGSKPTGPTNTVRHFDLPSFEFRLSRNRGISTRMNIT